MTLLIKKYKNRRLYDTEKSQYITVETLRDYVLQNRDFQVQDAANGKDLTNITLLQILLEMENGSVCFLSPEVLKHLIRLAQHPMQQSMNQLLEGLFAQMENAQETNPWKKGMEEWSKYLDMFKGSFK